MFFVPVVAINSVAIVVDAGAGVGACAVVSSAGGAGGVAAEDTDKASCKARIG